MRSVQRANSDGSEPELLKVFATAPTPHTSPQCSPTAGQARPRFRDGREVDSVTLVEPDDEVAGWCTTAPISDVNLHASRPPPQRRPWTGHTPSSAVGVVGGSCEQNRASLPMTTPHSLTPISVCPTTRCTTPHTTHAPHRTQHTQAGRIPEHGQQPRIVSTSRHHGTRHMHRTHQRPTSSWAWTAALAM